jgi:hypothetical protein
MNAENKLWILRYNVIVVEKGRYGKAISLQVWPGPVGFRRLKLRDLKTAGT